MSARSRIYDATTREVGNHRNTVARIAAREDEVKALSDAELRAMTDGFKERVQGGERPAPQGRGGSE